MPEIKFVQKIKLFWIRLTTYGQHRSLTKILLSFDPNRPTRDQVFVLTELMRWLGVFRRLNAHALDMDFEGLGIRYLLKKIEDNPEIKKNISLSLSKILAETDPTDFLVEVGLVNTNAFFSELMTCLILKRMPKYKDFTKLGTVTELLAESEFEPEWLYQLSDATIRAIGQTLDINPAAVQAVNDNFEKAFALARTILTSRIVSLASDSLFTSRMTREQLETLVAVGKRLDREMLLQSRLVINSVYGSLDRQGVSIELVFLIERMKATILRLESILTASRAEVPTRTMLHFIAEILVAQKKRYALAPFLGKNLALISKNIVERNTISGEHYIARNQAEREIIFLTSAGGGLIVTFTAIFKYATTHAGMPLLIEGLVNFLNYTISFFVIQGIGFTLATKTPALTASALASKLIDDGHGRDLEGFLKEVRIIVRSGALCIVGNVIFCMFTAVSVDTLYFLIFGTHIFTAQSAQKYLYAHHPFYSLALWYAALTGVILWLASAIGGWFENWFVFRGLPQAIAENNWLRAMSNPERTKQFSEWLTKNILGLSTSLFLSVFLASATVAGVLLGLPLDVRHVTLSSGTIALSLVAMPNLLDNWSVAVGAIVGIGLIGALNISVSLFVSFLVAGNARSLNWSQFKTLLGQSAFASYEAVRRMVSKT